MTTPGQHPTIFPEVTAIPAAYRQERIDQRCYLIDGELRSWDGPCQEVLSPICVATAAGPQRVNLGSFPLLGEKEALAALAAAVKAYDQGRGVWPTLPVSGRIAAVAAFAAAMRDCRDEVVRLLMWEIAKSRGDAEKEFDRTVAYIDDTIAALKELDHASSRFVRADGVVGQIRRAPLGVALCLGPFNYPLNETFTTLIPALIMGNTVVFKPPRPGTLLFGPLIKAMRDTFPAGVVNAIYGSGRATIPPLMSSGAIDVFAFIGTSRAANTLQKLHPRPHRLRLVLGLEAKNPAIVLADADLDLAVSECLAGALGFNGQRCTALKIIFVERPLAEAFVARLAAVVAALRCGLPWDAGVAITPLPEEEKPAYLAELLADARQQGATVVNPGGGDCDGSLFTPAVVYPVRAGMRLYTEEQFGPVIPVVPFDDPALPLDYVAASPYGQQASLFGRDPARLATFLDPLVHQVCRVNLNGQCQRGPDVFPFTGRKDSAVGTLSVADALRSFSIRTMVAAKETAANREILQRMLRERQSTFLSTDFLF